MNYAKEIKSRVQMKEIMQRYGFEVDRAGFCKCPFHSEKSGSFKTYSGDGGFHCFGCGAHGSVIDFVMKYFNLSFADSIKKINEDFLLGLPIDEKISQRKQIEIQKQSFLRKQEEKARKAKQDALDEEYWKAFGEWKRLDDNKRNYAPKVVGEALHPLFAEAIKNIEQAEYILDCAEFRRRSYENDCKNPGVHGR